MTNKVIVASHRRSGTHLMMDAIRSNFDIFRNSPSPSQATIDRLSSHTIGLTLEIADFNRRTGSAACVYKSHSHGYIGEFFKGSEELSDFAQDLFRSSKIIYVYRDGRDVMVSLYHYQRTLDKISSDITFSEFIRMPNTFDHETYTDELDRVAYWRFHVESWINTPCMFVSFEQLRYSYNETLQRVSQYISQPLSSSLIDVRQKPHRLQNSHFEKLIRILSPKRGRHSSVAFRKGTAGSWTSYFTSDDVAFFESRSGGLNQRLGYK